MNGGIEAWLKADDAAPRAGLRPIGLDIERGWIVLPDGGPSLGERVGRLGQDDGCSVDDSAGGSPGDSAGGLAERSAGLVKLTLPTLPASPRRWRSSSRRLARAP